MEFADGIGQSSEWLSMLLALWLKSTIILTAALLLTHKLRAASAKLRHILLFAALSGLLALPLFSEGLQPFRLHILPAGLFPDKLAAQQPSHNHPPLELPQQGSDIIPASQAPLALPPVNEQSSYSFSWQSIILLVWLLGALLVLGRFLIGLVSVRRLVAGANELTGTPWSELSSELSRELALKREVRLLQSAKSVMPMTCGGLSAVVVLPNGAEQWPADRRRVVVLHELIHIKRGDLLTQTLAQIVCALYWFNPLVWWAVRKLRVEQEWACDEHVLAAGVAAPDYAAHLLEIARSFHVDGMSLVTTTAIARPSQLQERLCAILKPVDKDYRSGRVIATAAFVLSAVFISTAFTQLVTAHQESETDVPYVTNDSSMLVEREELGTLLRERIADALAPVASDTKDRHTREQVPSPTPTPINQLADQPSASTNDAPASPQNTVENAQSYFGFTAEEQKRLASHGIGPAYIKEMADAGYSGLTVGHLIQLFSNSVRADYVAALKSVGYTGLSTNELLSLKTNGITREVIRSFQAETRASFKAKHYPAMLSNGVTPSYLKSLADAGYDSLSANKAIEFRLAGITSEFIGEARRRGHVNLSPNELIELKRREKY